MDRNIEIGVIFERKFSFVNWEDNYNDVKGIEYFMNIIDSSVFIFKWYVEIKILFFGVFKEYGESKIYVDEIGLFDLYKLMIK